MTFGEAKEVAKDEGCWVRPVDSESEAISYRSGAWQTWSNGIVQPGANVAIDATDEEWGRVDIETLRNTCFIGRKLPGYFGGLVPFAIEFDCLQCGESLGARIDNIDEARRQGADPLFPMKVWRTCEECGFTTAAGISIGEARPGIDIPSQ